MMLGNIRFDQLEEKLGYVLLGKDAELWEKYHNDSANLESMESCFHVFDIPRCIVFKGEEAKQAIMKMFRKENLVSPCGQFRVYEHKEKQ